MAQQLIPTSQDSPNYEQRTTLDGREYVLRFRWSDRSESWYFQLLDSNENVLTGLIRVVVFHELLRLHKGKDGMPPGEIIAVDTSGNVTRPNFDDLGTRVRLLYIPGADL